MRAEIWGRRTSADRVLQRSIWSRFLHHWKESSRAGWVGAGRTLRDVLTDGERKREPRRRPKKSPYQAGRFQRSAGARLAADPSDQRSRGDGARKCACSRCLWPAISGYFVLDVVGG